MPRKALASRDKSDSIDTKEIEERINKELNKKVELITENLKDKINEQVEFQVAKRLKEEEKKFTRGQKFKIIRLNFLIIILLTIICYFGYCLYDVDYFHLKNITIELPKEDYVNNNQNNNNINKDEPPKPTKEELIKEYEYLIKNIIIEDNAVFDLFKDSISTNNLSNELKLKLAYKNLDEKLIKNENDIISFEPNSLLVTLKQILGENITFENETFTYNSERFMFYNNTYLGMKEKENKSNFHFQIIDANLENETLKFDILTAKISENNVLLNNKNDIIKQEYNNEDLVNFQNYLDKYTVSFIKERDNYILKDIKINSNI